MVIVIDISKERRPTKEDGGQGITDVIKIAGTFIRRLWLMLDQLVAMTASNTWV